MEFEEILAELQSGFIGESQHSVQYAKLRESFFRGYQTRLGYAALGNRIPSYFVAELDGAVTVAKRVSQEVWDDFGVIAHTCLLPAKQNAIQVSTKGNDSVCLMSDLRADAFTGVDDSCETFLFCASSLQKTQMAFRRLAEGLWHSTGKERCKQYPRMGLGHQLVAKGDHDQGLSEGQQKLCNSQLFHTAHPLSAQFMRIPVRMLRAFVDGQTVKVGTDAGQLANALHENLFINCIPFWNQRVRVGWGFNLEKADGKARFTIFHETPQDPDIRILACTDTRGHQYLETSRLGSTSLEHGYFISKRNTRNGRTVTELVFSEAAQIQPGDLTVVFACGSEADPPQLNQERQISGCRLKVKYRTAGFQHHENIPWQAGIVPEAETMITRTDVRRNLIRYAPLALRDGLTNLAEQDIRIETQLRKIPSRLIEESGSPNITLPVVAIRFLAPACPVNDPELHRHYSELWEQRMEERCPVGTVFSIEWNER